MEDEGLEAPPRRPPKARPVPRPPASDTDEPRRSGWYVVSSGSSEYLSKRVARCLDYLAYWVTKHRCEPVLLDRDSQG